MNNLSISIPDWIPIEEAPKDGTLIDVWCPGENGGRFTDIAWGEWQEFLGYKPAPLEGEILGPPQYDWLQYGAPLLPCDPTHFRYPSPAPGQPNPYKEAIGLMVEAIGLMVEAIGLMVEAIENAPHDDECPGGWLETYDKYGPCNCWKSQTLAKVTDLFKGEGE